MENIPKQFQQDRMDLIMSSTTNNQAQNQGGNNMDKPKKEPIEITLHRLATENRNLYFDRNKKTYVEVQDQKQFENINNYLIEVNSEDFSEWITCQLFTNHHKTPTNQQIKNLKRVISREAKLNGQKIELHNRVTYIAGYIYIDLGILDRKVVKISSGSWEVGQFPVYFERHPHMKELPIPVGGGDLKELLDFLPPLSKHDQCLVLCWLVASFFEHIERPFLLIEGSPGSGKTTLGILLKSLIDPMEGAALSFNENENEVAQIIDHQFLPFFDNITTISRKLSDLFCRAFSGGSHVKKELYTDAKDFILKLSGSIIFSSIKMIKPKADLLDRCYKVVISKSSQSNRSKEEFTNRFEEAKPRIFGAILGTLSQVLAQVQATKINNSYRTVDFDRYAATAANILGYGADYFLEARKKCEVLKKDDVARNNPIVNGLRRLLESHGGKFEDYMTNVLNQLKADPKVAKEIPDHANVLSRRINELMAEINAAGINALKQKHNDGVGMMWTFELMDEDTSSPDYNSIIGEILEDLENLNESEDEELQSNELFMKELNEYVDNNQNH